MTPPGTVPAPEIGLVINYDFLWRTEAERGLEDGAKSRPCAVVLIQSPRGDHGSEVFVCAISHTPPSPRQRAVEIPYKVARHLNLDDGKSWIKTHELNVFTWDDARLPHGMAKTPRGYWSYGMIPPGLYRKVRDQVIENSRDGSLKAINRDVDIDP